MRITFKSDAGGSHVCHDPYPGCDSVIVSAIPACPACHKAPLKVAGIKGTQVTAHDSVTARAGCAECGKPLGTLTVAVDTIFGIEEDDRVLNHSRCRVY